MTRPEANAPTCWWCGACADSREHKFKASELRLNNGSGLWTGGAVVHGGDGKELKHVQSSTSKILKWSPSMCQNCNNARSQPFDLAYDTFIGYLDANERVVGPAAKFLLSEIYGEEWPQEQANLVKYWVKHICCRAAEIGLEVPQALRDYLGDPSANGSPPHIGLLVAVQGNFLKYRLVDGLAHGSGFGDADGYTREGQLVAFESCVTWSWFRVNYRFDITDASGRSPFDLDLVRMGAELIPWAELDTIPAEK
jgi:hypothetical protein